MLASVNTFAIDGVQARHCWALVDICPGLPAFHVVGLTDAATREARERVRGAIVSADFAFPTRRITATLAPADLRKAGPGFDAALAVGILAAAQQCSGERLEEFAIYGELTLSGELRPRRGTLAAAQAVRRNGLRGLIVPSACALEAAAVDGLQVVAADDLASVVRFLADGESPPLPRLREAVALDKVDGPDVSEIRGQQTAIRALEIAAAGGHNIVLVGARGTGLLALARRLPGLLPPLSHAEALEVTRIHSIAVLNGGGGVVTTRPFRAPHYTIAPAGLLGGGFPTMPGELTLSHRGVLLLDQLAEFARPALRELRRAAGHERIVVNGSTLPTDALFVGTVPSWNGDDCFRGEKLVRHRRHLWTIAGGFEMRVEVQAPDIMASPGSTSSEIRDRVVAARQVLRYSPIVMPDGTMRSRAQNLARTIAALDGRREISHEDFAEARSYATPA